MSDDVAHLIDRLALGRPGSVVRIRGQFHDVLVGPERVIARARTASAAARLPERARKLDAIYQLDLGVETPEVVHIDPAWIEMTRVAGSPLQQTAGLDDAVISQVAKDLGRFLERAAHADVAGLRSAGLTHSPPGKWHGFARDVRQHLMPMMGERGRRRARAELAAVEALAPVTTGLVHGDLGGDNLHFQQARGQWRLSGIVDWDEAHIGDPAEDLASLLATFGPEFVGDVIAFLGWPADVMRKVTAIRDTFALQQALLGHRDGDEVERDDGLLEYMR